MTRDTKGTLDAPQAHPLGISRQNLSLEPVAIAGVRLLAAAPLAARTPIPLLAIGRKSILMQGVAAAVITSNTNHDSRLTQHPTFDHYKSTHPDLPNATFQPGNPIDWRVFTRLAARKKLPNLDFDWGTTPPAPGMKFTYWSLKATGRIFVPKDDTYQFYFDELDDAGRLILDGKTIIDVWEVQKSTPSSGKMFLNRGPHDIRIEYVQGPATAASIKLSWQSTSFSREIVGVYRKPTDD